MLNHIHTDPHDVKIINSQINSSYLEDPEMLTDETILELNDNMCVGIFNETKQFIISVYEFLKKNKLTLPIYLNASPSSEGKSEMRRNLLDTFFGHPFAGRITYSHKSIMA